MKSLKVQVNMSADEKRLCMLAARASGLSLSTWLRCMAGKAAKVTLATAAEATTRIKYRVRLSPEAQEQAKAMQPGEVPVPLKVTQVTTDHGQLVLDVGTAREAAAAPTICANCHQGQHKHDGSPHCLEPRCQCPCKRRANENHENHDDGPYPDNQGA